MFLLHINLEQDEKTNADNLKKNCIKTNVLLYFIEFFKSITIKNSNTFFSECISNSMKTLRGTSGKLSTVG